MKNNPVLLPAIVYTASRKLNFHTRLREENYLVFLTHIYPIESFFLKIIILTTSWVAVQEIGSIFKSTGLT